MRKIDNFDKYLKYKGLNDNQATKDCNLSVGLLGQARSGKCDLGTKAIEKILNKYQDISRMFLLTGEGPMLTPSASQVINNGANSVVIGGDSTGNIYNGAGAASHHTQAEDEIPYAEQVPVVPATIVRQGEVDTLEYLQRNINMVEISSVRVDDANLTIWLPMPDDCMAPEIRKGDRLGLWAYPNGKENPVPGKIYAVDTISNGFIVRYLFLTADGDYIMRAHDRELYPDFVVKKDDVRQVYKKLIMVRI